MYNEVSQAYKTKIAEPSRTFRARLVNVNNAKEIIDSGFLGIKSYSQSNEDTETLSLGGTVSQYIEVQVFNPPFMVTGKEFEYQIGLLLNDDTIEYIPIGRFTAEKPTEEDGLVTFTAYDRFVSKLGYLFSSTLTYPTDGKNILKEIQTKSGITINYSSLPDGIVIPKRSVISDSDETGGTATTYENPFDGFTYRETIGYLATMYGKFATINRQGAVEFRWYTESGHRVETNESYGDINCAETEYQVKYVECTIGSNSENVLTSGSGATGISCNAPVMNQTILNSIYSKVGGMKYLPTTLSYKGDPRTDLGDIVTVVKRDSTEIKVPIMSLNFDFDGGLINEVGSYGDTEESSESRQAGPAAKRMDRVYSELLLVKEVVATKASIGYLQANYASITELDAVSAKIDKITATDITTEYLESHYADLDFINVDTANIRQGFLNSLMVDQGIIADRVVAGKVTATDVLTGVNIYADDITAGTLSVERLVFRGSINSVVYELNSISGALQSVNVNTLNGEIITPRSITADRIVAQSITANEINVTNLISDGLIEANKLTAKNIDVNNLMAQSITASGTLQSSNFAYTSGNYSTAGIKLNMSTGQIISKSFAIDSIGNAYFAGNLVAPGGTIAGWSINATSLYRSNATFGAAGGMYIGTSGISCGSTFKVDSAGALTATSATIEGNIYGYDKIFMKNKNISYNGTYPSYAVINTSISGVSFCGVLGTSGGKEFIFFDSANYTTLNGYKLFRTIIRSDVQIEGGLYCNNPLSATSIATSTLTCNSTAMFRSTVNFAGSSSYYLATNGNIYAYAIVSENNAGYYCGNTAGTNIRILYIGSNNNCAVGNNDLSYLLLYGKTCKLSSTSGATVTSDERLKNSFKDLTDYEEFFMDLGTCAFKYNKGTSNRYHVGFRAQNVYKALTDNNLSSTDFAGYVKMYISPDDEDYQGFTDELGLIYTEFTALNTHMIQKTIHRVDSHDERIKELEDKLDTAQKRIDELESRA